MMKIKKVTKAAWRDQKVLARKVKVRGKVFGNLLMPPLMMVRTAREGADMRSQMTRAYRNK